MTFQVTKEGTKLINILAAIASFSDRKKEENFCTDSVFLSLLRLQWVQNNDESKY